MNNTNKDAKEYLDRLLAKAPSVEYKRTVQSRREVCRYEPSDADSPGKHLRRVCELQTFDTIQRYSDQPRVKSTEVVEVMDLEFLKEKVVLLPERALLARQRFENCANVQSSTTLSLSISGTRGFSITKSSTVATTSGGSVTLAYVGAFGSLNTSFSFTRSVTLGKSTTENYSESVGRSLATTISIPPLTSGIASLLAYETTVEIPFQAKVVIDAELVHNESGVTRASTFLDRNARTVPFSGAIILRNVSESLFRTEALPGPVCDVGNKQGTVQSEITEFILPASSITEEQLKGFCSFSDALGGLESNLALVYSDSATGPVIGPIPDGIHYTIIYTRPFSRPHIGCGFSDLGQPNLGLFLAEGREYVEYRNNQEVRRWFEENEVFTGCWSA